MRTPVEWLAAQYQTNLFVAAFHICKNAEDAKDVVQDTFVAYLNSNQQFHDEQHIRAWLQFAPSGGRKCVFQRPLCGAERPLVFS